MQYRFAYTGIRVRELERSLHFYTKILGMQEIKRGQTTNGGTYVVLHSPDSPQELELNYYPEGTKYGTRYIQSGDEMDHLCFTVNDVEAAFKELVRSGVKVAVAPSETKEKQTEVYVKDPDGIWIELLQRQ